MGYASRLEAQIEAEIAALKHRSKAEGLPNDLSLSNHEYLPAGSDCVQGYDTQAVVDAASMLILAYDCVQASNDKQQVEPIA
jgi:hypothetical protein